ncbi:hypothetical protein LC593_35890 [Nostoc sp. CHAB 5844]|nr:hypothetical protein [Nostoc sp. CHAB 5844]
MGNDILASNNNSKLIKMIDVEHVATLKWGTIQAKKLTQLRGFMPRRLLEEKTVELGLRVSHQYIQQLEQPENYVKKLKSKTLTVSVDVVNVLCEALDANIDYFFSTSQISTIAT